MRAKILNTLAHFTGQIKQDNFAQIACNNQIRSLDQLLAHITDKNRHHEIDTGKAVGFETW